MIKLLALDMDGTLLNSQKKISQENISAIHKAIKAGVKLVLCTGRPPFGVRPYYELLGLAQEDEYVIVDNGCAIHRTSDWAVIDSVALDKQDIHYLYSLTQDSSIQLTLFDEEHYFVVGETPSPIVVRDTGYVFTSPTEISLEEAVTGKYTMFQAMFLAEKEIVDIFEEKYASDICQRFSGVRSQDVIYEVMPAGVTKAFALEKLAKKLGIPSEDIMALGDANNDLEMLKFAGLGIAMGNASDYVKSHADDVTDPNDENGVAKAFEKYLLNYNSRRDQPAR